MKAKALHRTLFTLFLVLLLFLTGCFSTAPSADSDISAPETTAPKTISKHYVLNSNTEKFHCDSCHWVDKIKDENRRDYTGDRADLIAQGYAPCKTCCP